MTSHTAPSLPLRRIATALGWLCLFTTLALLSPGVVLTANGEEAAEPPACQVDRSPSFEVDQVIEQLRARAAVQMPAEGDDEIVVLNNRGYFYAPEAPPTLELAPLR